MNAEWHNAELRIMSMLSSVFCSTGSTSFLFRLPRHPARRQTGVTSQELLMDFLFLPPRAQRRKGPIR
jgi:hypothetical protein